MPKAKEIGGKGRDGLLETLKARFEAHMPRHAGPAAGAVIAAGFDCADRVRLLGLRARLR